MSNKVKNEKLKIKGILLRVLPFTFCLLPLMSKAQCAMCRASLESSGNTTQAEAVNDGIVFLMAIPYILVATLGFIIYRLFNKKKG